MVGSIAKRFVLSRSLALSFRAQQQEFFSEFGTIAACWSQEPNMETHKMLLSRTGTGVHSICSSSAMKTLFCSLIHSFAHLFVSLSCVVCPIRIERWLYLWFSRQGITSTPCPVTHCSQSHGKTKNREKAINLKSNLIHKISNNFQFYNTNIIFFFLLDALRQFGFISCRCLLYFYPYFGTVLQSIPPPISCVCSTRMYYMYFIFSLLFFFYFFFSPLPCSAVDTCRA